MLHLSVLLNTLCLSQYVLHVYTPDLNKDSGVERGNTIRSYFSQEFTNAEIAGFLALQHGIVLSVRTLRRILQRLGPKRARCDNEAPLERIVAAIPWSLYGQSSTNEALEANVQFASKKRYCYEIPSRYRP